MNELQTDTVGEGVKLNWSERLRRLAKHAKFEMALLCMLLLTGSAVIWRDQILERSIHLTPTNTASSNRALFSDGDIGGKTTVEGGKDLSWSCEVRSGITYPYCGMELFLDRNKGIHGLDLRNMRGLTITMMYRGPSTSFRVHLKNFDPRYSDSAGDDTPKYMKVEATAKSGIWQRTEFAPRDFNVAEWWMLNRSLPPELGRLQFDNITSLNVETGSRAPAGHYSFKIKDITIRKTILSESQWYSLLLGLWTVIIAIYLGYRISNLRRSAKERRILEEVALREAQEAARRDPLTGLLNRRGLIERFATMIAGQRRAANLAVILIDIDHFKNLNDTYGHDFGDQILRAFAGVIGQNIRAADVAARWGGRRVYCRLCRC